LGGQSPSMASPLGGPIPERGESFLFLTSADLAFFICRHVRLRGNGDPPGVLGDHDDAHH
jgi:hypothetical protein